MLKKIRKHLGKAFAFLLILYVMLAASLYFFQEKLLFIPSTLDLNYTFNFDTPFEELFLKPDEQTVINAIHFKVKNPKGVILYFHGNAGDLSRWGNITEYFTSYNYDVFVIDYRTYGKSKGKLSEAAFYSDAQYCYNYVLKRYAENNIILYGRSLGTALASYLASIHKPGQLILETPYYSILDVAKYRFPFLPVRPFLKYNFPNYNYLPKATCPITIIHGTDDRIVPYQSGKKLLHLNLGQINFISVPGGRHNNLVDFEIYHNTIKSVLE